MPHKRPEKYLLIVDDSADTRELLQRNLSGRGYEALTAVDVAEAMRIIETTHFDLVITDLKMPGISGLNLIRHVRENLIDTEVMMITGYPSVEGAVAAVKIGAEEYLSKPFTKEELFAAVERTLEKLELRRAGRALPERQAPSPLGMIGESEAMQKVFRAASRAATAKLPTLIIGENGTGRELLARAIHFSGPRHRSRFAAIHCAGLGEDDLDGLLFGDCSPSVHETFERHIGMLESIGSGTLYLDDITDLSDALQNRLYGVLEEKKIFPAGPGEPAPVNAMLIAGTTRNLHRLLETGAFKEELFVRLNMSAISVPPLRERGNDVIIIARYFLTKYARGLSRPAPGLSEQAMAAFKAYSWPGNITELENTMIKLLDATDARVIDIPHLPSHMRYSAVDQVRHGRSLAEIESEHIKNVIASVGGNKTRAADILGINRKTLREKLRHNNIPIPPD